MFCVQFHLVGARNQLGTQATNVAAELRVLVGKPTDVRVGSLADIAAALPNVCFYLGKRISGIGTNKECQA
jgi:hypothetical protein